MSLFILCIWKRLPNKYRIIDLIFFLEYFEAVAPSSSVLHCFRWEILILEMNCISLSVCSFCGFKYFEFGIYLRIVFFFSPHVSSSWGSLRFLDGDIIVSTRFGKISVIIPSNIFLSPSLPWGAPVAHLLGWLKLYHSSWIKSSAYLLFIFYPV